MTTCPLCSCLFAEVVLKDGEKVYFDCSLCRLRYLAPESHLSPEEEKKRYLHHENRVDDPKYREFLRPLFERVAEQVKPPAEGLDYGAGTGPALAAMFQESGYGMRLYDPFFHPDEASLGRTYDFVAVSETSEHFREPGKEFARLKKLLKPGGWLAVMTLMWEPETPFGTWHYRLDPTHIAFYKRETFRWITDHYQFSYLEYHDPRVILLKN
jgi:SAM-dependent methyltransferase